jgi:hypothetical protein
MRSFKVLYRVPVALAGITTAVLVAGCASHRTEIAYEPATPAYVDTTAGATANVIQTAPLDLPMAVLRTDITDNGPGTVRGDATSADPSESVSQGAGSRALVGQPSDRGGMVVVREYPTAAYSGAGVDTTSQSSGAYASSSSTIIDLSMLSADNATAYAGREVRISNARVKALVDPRLIAVTSGSSRPVYVRLQQPLTNLREGARVDITGTVRQTADAAFNELSGDAAHILSTQPVFIDAQSVQVR